MNSPRPQHLDAFIDWYEKLTPQSLDTIATYYAHDVYFRDPFHAFADRDRLHHVYARMFESLEEPRFHIDAAITEANESALYWRFTFRYRSREMTITGTSRIRFAADGRVESHIDYWDAASQIYERIPLLGTMLRALRRRIAGAMGPRPARQYGDAA